MHDRGDVLRQLVEQTARVPFNDRLNREATSEDLRITLVREFLRDIGSDLLAETSSERIYASMRIIRPVNGHAAPTNAGLLFFSEDPRRWFRGARLEVARFEDGAGGNTIEERVFLGPLHHQLRQCLTYLQNLTTTRILKGNGSEARRWVDYPIQALREAVVNAVYHRSYEPSFPDPTKVYLYPDRVEVISYPGPVQGIELFHLTGEIAPPPLASRNRQIGEFLKELRLAEARGTGMPRIFRSMRENGSPEPRLDFDSGRTYFRVTLPAHPEYVALAALRAFAYRRATGDPAGALRCLREAHVSMPNAASITVELLRALASHQEWQEFNQVLEFSTGADASSQLYPGERRFSDDLARAIKKQTDLRRSTGSS